MKQQGLAANERIQSLDIIRGIALLGIVLANMSFFKSQAIMSEVMLVQGYVLPGGGFDAATRLFTTAFIDGKFYPMFSMLFGLGFYIFYHRLLQKDVNATRVFVRRLVFLIVIGLVHLFMIWSGDILFTYGITGFLLLAFVSRTPKTILIWAGSILVSATVLLTLLNVLGGIGIQLSKSAGLSSLSEMKAYETALAEQMAGGGYAEVWLARLPDVLLMFFNAFMVIPGIFPLFLLGLYFGKKGMFKNAQEYARLWKKIWVHSLWAGLLGTIVVTALIHNFTPLPSAVGFGLAQGLRTLTGPILMLFYVSSLVLLTQKETWQRMLKPFANAGRMALTNYLMQSIVLVFVFYGFGFGLYGQVGEGVGFLIGVGLFVVQVILSTLYLKKFNQGPMEYVWRKWTYGRSNG